MADLSGDGGDRRLEVRQADGVERKFAPQLGEGAVCQGEGGGDCLEVGQEFHALAADDAIDVVDAVDCDSDEVGHLAGR